MSLQKTINKAMIIVWKSLGVTIEDLKEESGHMTLFMSVPETSYHVDAHGNEMAGNLLIKRIKKNNVEMGYSKALTINGRVRPGEHWTEEMANVARAETTDFLFKGVKL